MRQYLHFNSFHLYSPWVGGLIKCGLHCRGNGFTLRKDISQIFSTKNISKIRKKVKMVEIRFYKTTMFNLITRWISSIGIPECCCSQEPCWLSIIIDIWDGANCVRNFVVHNCIHMNRNRVFCQNLFGADKCGKWMI